MPSGAFMKANLSGRDSNNMPFEELAYELHGIWDEDWSVELS